MKIEFAKTIPLREILIKLGFKALRTKGNASVYLSPLTDNCQDTLIVYTKTNTWFDSQLNIGGGPIEFTTLYLKATGVNHTEDDGLRWLKNIMCKPSRIEISADILPPVANSVYDIRGVLPLTHFALLQFFDAKKLDRRYIQHFRELRVFNRQSRKCFRAIGFKNEDGGFAIYNPVVNAFTGTMAISFIRGEKPKPDNVHLFVTIFDYLSLISARKGRHLDGDAIILNSYHNLNDAIAYISNYGYAASFIWFENSKAGFAATKALTPVLLSDDGMVIRRMNSLYLPFQSVNEWWQSKTIKHG